jgi:uncharacterized membrane protein
MEFRFKAQKLFIISIIALLCFNFPFISVFNKPSFIFGVPQLYFFLFLCWLMMIAVIYLLMYNRKDNSKSDLNKDE